VEPVEETWGNFLASVTTVARWYINLSNAGRKKENKHKHPNWNKQEVTNTKETMAPS
jgi:hypothetical protein